jgi:hypothetical protein
MCISVAVLIAALALTVMPTHAKAASPVLEFVTPGSAFPVGFTATGGPVTAALAGFDSVVNCTGSHGEGEITGPRSTLSNFEFTGCKAQGGNENGQKCKSAGAANDEEITAEAIEADLVYINQAKHEVGMLLNPGGGLYMSFVCGGELVEASGPFLSPVDPINKELTSFTATLNRLGATQIPGEYENALGEKRQAIPMGKREGDPTPATTGVELGFTIHTNVSLQIKAVTAAEIEAKQREDEAAAAATAKKRHEEEAAAEAATKKRQTEEAATAAAVKERQEEEAKSERRRRTQLSSAIKQCRKAPSKHKRVQCEKWAKKTYGSAKPH